MKKQAVFEIIRGQSLFSSLTDDEIAKIIRISELRKYCAYEVIDSFGCIAVILRGNVAATKKVGEKNLLMRMLGASSISGVATLFSETGDTLSTLTALKTTEVLFIPQTAVLELIYGNGNFAENYIRFLTSRIRFLNDRIHSYTSQGAEAKLALHLLLSDEAMSGEVVFDISYTKLADMLDIGRASLYRAIEQLEEKGIIRKEGKKIYILNRTALHDKT